MTMKNTIASLCFLALPAVAFAQPAEPPVTDTPAPEVTSTTTTTEITPTTTTVQQVTSYQTPAPAITMPRRPDGFSLGLGFGYGFAPVGNTQTDITVINTTSVRARLESGMQFEAVLRAGLDSSKADDGTTESTDKFSEFTIGGQVHIPVMSREKTDLNFIGMAQLGLNKYDPEGDDNNTTTTSFALGYGAEVQYWLTKHMTLAVQADNFLFSTSKSTSDLGGGDEVTITDTTLALIWDPTVRFMFHLYF